MSFSVLAAALAVCGHPDSSSTSLVRIEGARATVELTFQALSLLEVRPDFERTPDRMLDAQEADAARAEIGAYLLENFRLLQGDGGREEALVGRLEALEPQDPRQVSPLALQEVTARFVFEAASPIEGFELEVGLFHETNPWHRDMCTVRWNDDGEVKHLFGQDGARWRFEPAHVRRPGVLARFLRAGFDRIRTGLDQQAFLLALLVAARRGRALLGVLGTFALAHSLGLVLGALGWVSVPPRFVELAVALAIAYVACDSLLRREARDPWLEAALFGLLNGLGFAAALAEPLAGEPLRLTACSAFDLGLVLGQLAFAGACGLLVALLFRAHRRRTRGEPAAGIVPSSARSLVSILVALCGFYWFVERAGWLPWR